MAHAERIHEQMARHRGRKDIVLIDQVPRNDTVPLDDAQSIPPSVSERTPPDLMLALGKGDAVRKGIRGSEG